MGFLSPFPIETHAIRTKVGLSPFSVTGRDAVAFKRPPLLARVGEDPPFPIASFF